MKKVLIAYSTKTDTSRLVSEYLKAELKGNIDIVDLDNSKIDLNQYDIIIIGSPIRIGMLSSKTKSFIKNNHEILNNKNHAFFIYCLANDSKIIKEYFEKNIESSLLNSAITYNTFGGELDFNKLKGLTKLLLKVIAKNQKDNIKPSINYQNIKDFAKEINNISK